MKTIAFEICEQLTSSTFSAQSVEKPDRNSAWISPDWYFQSVSGGIGPLGVLKGFFELYEMGLIDHIPAIAGIQPAGCAPMVNAWQANQDIANPIVSPRTHIATLSTGDPGRAYSILRQRMQAGGGGLFESVSDEEAFRAMHILAKLEGLSVEPAAAVAFAGLIKLVRAGVVHPEETIVINCTGHTMPIEPTILGEGWSRNISLSSEAIIGDSTVDTPIEGLLAALDRISVERYPRVLIVDDTEEARRLIRRILQSQGNYIIFEAVNGLQAVELAEKELPDIIILDLMMPELDGFGVLDALKANIQAASIPVVVVTAKVLSIEEKARLNGRVHSLMQKGEFLSDDLLGELHSLTDK